ncbi:N utilization substance protein B [Rickettsiales bacterium Ac37b]|nr:N utilization substance protein B [Rickettsiales bacterium Ac37b]
MNEQKSIKLSLANTRKMMARLAAVQAVYAYEINNVDNLHLMQLLNNYFDKEFRENELNIQGEDLIPDKEFFTVLMNNTIKEQELLDDIITQYLTESRRLNQLSLVLKCILRVAICELKFMSETPQKVVINEYTNIAHAFYEDIEAGFVNGILDKIIIDMEEHNTSI